jgi:hypothetical protein
MPDSICQVKCIYCLNTGHRIQTCGEGLELNNLLDRLVEPDFSKLKRIQLQRLASMNGINITFTKKELVNKLSNIWKEKERLRNLHFECQECSICLNTINNNNYSILPCGHKFHFNCILFSLQHNDTCPICRIKVNVNFEYEPEYIDNIESNFYIDASIDSSINDNINMFNRIILSNQMFGQLPPRYFIVITSAISFFNNVIYNIGKFIQLLYFFKNNQFIQLFLWINLFITVNNIYKGIIEAESYNFSYDFI